MNGLLIACILTPMVTAALSFVVTKSAKVRGVVSVIGSIILLALSLILLYQVVYGGPVSNQMGGWQAPMGITLIADMLSAMLIVVTAIVALSVNVYAMGDISEDRIAGGFFTFLNMLIAGVVGAFLTGDLFNLYVWFEVMLISSFALLVLGGNKVQLDGAVKYVAINLISTVLLLTALVCFMGSLAHSTWPIYQFVCQRLKIRPWLQSLRCCFWWHLVLKQLFSHCIFGCPLRITRYP